MAIPIETGAGPLRDLFAYDKRVTIDDGAGNFQGVWQEQFQAYTGKTALVGGEAIRASRLAGLQPYVLTVRYDEDSAQITNDWRARDCDTGRTYAIRAVTERNRRYVDIMAVDGEAE